MFLKPIFVHFTFYLQISAETDFTTSAPGRRRKWSDRGRSASRLRVRNSVGGEKIPTWKSDKIRSKNSDKKFGQKIRTKNSDVKVWQNSDKKSDPRLVEKNLGQKIELFLVKKNRTGPNRTTSIYNGSVANSYDATCM
jgi:hypothetical protein